MSHSKGKGAARRQRKLRGAHLPSSEVRRQIRAIVFARDLGICRRCGKPVDPTAPHNTPERGSLDHIFPFVLGGRYTPENLRLVHRGCEPEQQSGCSGNAPG